MRRTMRRVGAVGLAIGLVTLAGCADLRARFFPPPPPLVIPAPEVPKADPPAAPEPEPPVQIPVAPLSDPEPIPPPVLGAEEGGGERRVPAAPPPTKIAPAPPPRREPPPPKIAPAPPVRTEPIPPPVLAPQVGKADEERMRRESEARIQRAEQRLGDIDPKRLSAEDREALATVRNFLAMAKDAIEGQDFLRAAALSEKARVLADDLSSKAK